MFQHHCTTDLLLDERQRDAEKREGRSRPSLIPANHWEQCAPIVHGAITRVDEKKGIRREREREREREKEDIGKKSCHAS